MFLYLKRSLSKYFAQNIYLYLVLFAILTTGVVVGVQGLNNSAQGITQLNNNLNNTQISFNEVVYTSFLKNIKFIIWIFASSMSIIGFPLICYLIYSKGVSLGCSVAAILSTTSQTTQVIIISTILPQIIFSVLSFIFISQYGMSYSINIFRKTILNENVRGNFMKQTGILLINLALSAVFVLLSAICEGIFIPYIPQN